MALSPSSSSPAPLARVEAAPSWRSIDFVSDVHLHAQNQTWHAFFRTLERTTADAVFLLGDLFELWAGDDAMQPESIETAAATRFRRIAHDRPLFFLHGNRDFLVGAAFCAAAGLTLLADPCVLTVGGQRVLLSHGDALCIDDVAYQRFRTMTRQPRWQAEFLARPVAERLAMAHEARRASAEHQGRMGVEGHADVDAELARQWLAEAGSQLLLHGHTHRPATHELPGQPAMTRVVLSDWELDAQPPRGDVLRLHIAGDSLDWERLPLARLTGT